MGRRETWPPPQGTFRARPEDPCDHCLRRGTDKVMDHGPVVVCRDRVSCMDAQQ